jgi:hypothetical protein
LGMFVSLRISSPVVDTEPSNRVPPSPLNLFRLHLRFSRPRHCVHRRRRCPLRHPAASTSCRPALANVFVVALSPPPSTSPAPSPPSPYLANPATYYPSPLLVSVARILPLLTFPAHYSRDSRRYPALPHNQGTHYTFVSASYLSPGSGSLAAIHLEPTPSLVR